MGYHIKAQDGKIGHVEDFVIDDDTWTLRYMVVDTRNWLPGRKVLIATNWMGAIRWEDRQVTVELTRETVKESPEYDDSAPVTREYEARLHEHFRRTSHGSKP